MGMTSLSKGLRRQVLREEPLCRRCKEQPSTEVDHRLPRSRGGTDDRWNLEGLCGPCHARKTEWEFGPRAAYAEADRRRKEAGVKPPHWLRFSGAGDDPCPFCGYPDDLCSCGYVMGDDGEIFPLNPMASFGGIVWQRQD